MSEIEKMYENVGVKFIIGVRCKAKIGDGCNSRCPDCDYNTKPKEYPPFTAEKQLRLTTFIGLHYGFQMLKNESFDYIIATRIYVKYEYEYKGYGYGYNEAIANLINNLWQDLTEEERRQIKEILE